MDELTLGLIGAGAVVVGGVVVYNAWQSAKVRRRMPRPMPDDAADSLARQDADEEQPFIEPVRPARREPAIGEGEATDARVEIESLLEVHVDQVIAADAPVERHRLAVDVDALQLRKLASGRQEVLRDILEIAELVEQIPEALGVQ